MHGDVRGECVYFCLEVVATRSADSPHFHFIDEEIFAHGERYLLWVSRQASSAN